MPGHSRASAAYVDAAPARQRNGVSFGMPRLLANSDALRIVVTRSARACRLRTPTPIRRLDVRILHLNSAYNVALRATAAHFNLWSLCRRRHPQAQNMQ